VQGLLPALQIEASWFNPHKTLRCGLRAERMRDPPVCHRRNSTDVV